MFIPDKNENLSLIGLKGQSPFQNCQIEVEMVLHPG
jgi:hypothetical protein